MTTRTWLQVLLPIAVAIVAVIMIVDKRRAVRDAGNARVARIAQRRAQAAATSSWDDLMERHVDQALELAEPTPTLRRVK